MPAAEVVALFPGDTMGVLRPSNWALMGGQGWRCIVIERVTLARAFPVDGLAKGVDDEDKSREKVPSLVPKKSGWKLRLALEILRECWPNGMPEVKPHIKTDLITKPFRKKLRARAEQDGLGAEAIATAEKETIGYSTITKAERLIKNGKKP